MTDCLLLYKVFAKYITRSVCMFVCLQYISKTTVPNFATSALGCPLQVLLFSVCLSVCYQDYGNTTVTLQNSGDRL